jgi:hypothetical protein
MDFKQKFEPTKNNKTNTFGWPEGQNSGQGNNMQEDDLDLYS